MIKDWKLYAMHILVCVEKINVICKRGDIAQDFMLCDATLRNLQTLSESTSHLPEDLKAKHNNIDWRAISKFRNILVHNYLGEIDITTIKKVVNEYLPALEKALKTMLDQ